MAEISETNKPMFASHWCVESCVDDVSWEL